jgi:hypothetical protein
MKSGRKSICAREAAEDTLSPQARHAHRGPDKSGARSTAKEVHDMSNITTTWTADIAMAAGCVVPSHRAATRVRGAADLQALTAKPSFGTGHRTWSPPLR